MVRRAKKLVAEAQDILRKGREEEPRLLAIALSAAVPLWIEELKKRPGADVLERAKICGQHIAEGIACLAFAPGGVRLLGMHFEAKHPDWEHPK